MDVGNAGTVLRFLPAVAALTPARVDFDGDERIRQRPVGPILAALANSARRIDDGGRGAAPFSVLGTGRVRGGPVTLDASSSSQLISGLLLAAPRFDEGIEIRHEGPPVPSAPHIAMTVRMLRAAGAEVTETGPGGPAARPDAWQVRPGRLELGRRSRWNLTCPTPGPFLAAALITGGTVTVPGWPRDSLQAAGQILDVLARMGARCVVGADGLTIIGTGTVRGITADLRDVAELAPVLTAVAALADRPSTFTGLAHTRGTRPTGWPRWPRRSTPSAATSPNCPTDCRSGRGRCGPRRPARPFGSYDDHRMVMAAAVLGLAVPGLRVANAQTVAKTFPGFTDGLGPDAGPRGRDGAPALSRQSGYAQARRRRRPGPPGP